MKKHIIAFTLAGFITGCFTQSVLAPSPIKAETLHLTDDLIIWEQADNEVNEIITQHEPTLYGADFELICRVVSAEARGESLEGQMAVAETIKNRSIAWNKTPVEIVTAPYQYAKPYQGEIPENVKIAVEAVFNQNHSVLDNKNVMYFHADYMTPYWVSSVKITHYIGSHKFYEKI